MTVLTVTQVNTYIKALFDEAMPLRSIYISGEISNFLHYYKSGHMYFTLKDDKSQIKCVMFSSFAEKVKFDVKDGMKVICFGRISTYEKDGAYQLYVQDMQPQGIGALTIAFEQLKAKLSDEGLFDDSHKKPIPRYPNKIGVATSNMGAAVEDIKNILSRRYPLCDVIIVPTVVQGDGAPADIVKSIKFLDALDGIDTIIVGRGGGSIEDLWAFNTEEVARAVYNCKTPIISAVGHETDFTICDFVADLRAPTPSAGAELAVVDIANEKLYVNNLSASLDLAINRFVEKATDNLENLVDNSQLSDIDGFFDAFDNKLSDYNDKMKYAYSSIVLSNEALFKGLVAKLDALSPLRVLSRGYAIVDLGDSTVNTANQLSIGDNIKITFNDGYANATVNEVNINE
jgi:exodeoxyribonuclease VII large subunit